MPQIYVLRRNTEKFRYYSITTKGWVRLHTCTRFSQLNIDAMVDNLPFDQGHWVEEEVAEKAER